MDISSVGDRSCNPITLFTANPDGSGEVVKVVNGHYSRAYSHPQRVFATIEQMRVLSSSVLVPGSEDARKAVIDDLLLSLQSNTTERNPSDPEITQLIQSFPDLAKAGGALIRGTPWNSESDDTILRTYFSYEQYETFENDLITRVQEAHRHISYDFVVALPTGGVSLGVKASQTLGIPLHYAHATSYDAQGNKGDMHMEGIEAFLASLPPSPARILLIDDLSDSGDSFVFMKKLLEGRRYTVETAAIFAKKDTKHIPSFCLFPKFSGTWIVQPSEYREGPVAGHDVAGIKDHPVTQCIEIVVEKISAILDQYKSQQNAYKTLQFFVPPDAFDSRVSMAIAKILKDKYKVGVKFISNTIDPRIFSTDERIDGEYGAYILKTSIISDDILWISLETDDETLKNENDHNRRLAEGMRVHVVNRPAVHFVIFQRQPVQNHRAERLKNTLLNMYPSNSCSIRSYHENQKIESENGNIIKIYL